MKIQTAEKKRGVAIQNRNDDYYKTISPHGDITMIDNDGNFIDLYERTALLYRIEEAEELVTTLKNIYPDYIDDPYYGQGIPIYPLYQTPYQLPKLTPYKWKNGLMLYRYKQAGEWIYGITNKWAEDKPNYARAIEAPMDGWDKWLSDRKQMLRDQETASRNGNMGL